jgi:gamma-glutamyltranspeptidase / glutathione hydrolase
MVASEDAHATQIGAEVLAAGGNAIDAAVAVGYALAVTHPVAGSLGGGGFMVVRLKDGTVHAIDYREMAPAKATQAANDKQLKGGAHGYLSAPVPGVVAGLDMAREKFGTRPLAALMAPAIALADSGHDFSPRQAMVLEWTWKRLKDPTLRALLGKGKDPIRRGHLLKQPRLAETLRAIAAKGDAGFYQGDVAAKIADAMKKQGGLVTLEDLAAYRAKEREPLHVVYRGIDVYTMPPPSMGGIAVAAILMNLQQFRASDAPAGSAASLHAFTEAARRAYADRRSVGADPEASGKGALLAKLLDPAYYASRAPAFDPGHATPSTQVKPVEDAPGAEESHDTTHFSVVDDQGNAVACTTTLSAAFGAWVAVPGTGVILSNAMGAFSGSGVNAIAPGKRMASSMSPTLLVRDGKTVAVLGSPGGDTIPGTVAQVARNLIDYGMTIDAAVDAARLHHQFRPDVLHFERLRAPEPTVLGELAKLGHKVARGNDQGAANCIVIDPDTGAAYGYADPRKGGLALGPSGSAAGAAISEPTGAEPQGDEVPTGAP